MNLLVVGATGGTGRALVDQALAQGHHVTALVRKPAQLKAAHERLTVVTGDVLDPDAVDAAVRGKDAVLCTLGHKRWIIPTTILSRGTRNIVSAMEKHGVKRFICETSLGVGNSRGRLGLYYTLFVIPFIIFLYFVDKRRQERIIESSSLDWVIIRPGRLTNGRKRGVYRHGEKVGNYVWTVSISRADVADFMLRQLTDDSYLHLTPGVAYQCRTLRGIPRRNHDRRTTGGGGHSDLPEGIEDVRRLSLGRLSHPQRPGYAEPSGVWH